MSDADLLPYESLSAAQCVTKPYLVIYSDNSFLPDAARRHFEAMLSTRKTPLREGDTPHRSYDDQPEAACRQRAASLSRPDDDGIPTVAKAARPKPTPPVGEAQLYARQLILLGQAHIDAHLNVAVSCDG